MSHIVRTPLVDSVAAELHRRMAAGELAGDLPGARSLAKAIGVSVPTLCKALHKLRDHGLLVAGGDRKRWHVGALPPLSAALGKSSAKRFTSRPGKLLFVSALPLSIERHTGVEVFSHILDLLGAKGWEVTHRHVPFVSARKPHRAWDELLRRTKPDAMLVMGGSEVFATWAVQNRIRTLFLGGDSGKHELPTIMVRVSPMLRQALEKLIATGHGRILIPLCGRIPSFAEKCRKQIAECTTDLGINPDSVVIAESEYSSPDVIVGALRQHWRKQAPDALIIFDWREYLAASCFLKEAGISVPKDLSVALLSHNPTMDWHIPSLCHFVHPVEEIARASAKWVLQGKPLPGERQFMEFSPRWVEGKSIIQRNQKARPT